ncbi:YfhO family protein [Clostridium sardiniense]|uniref:YfhO family protein n=1 Tax=Clostridium sardiniense TaxID=29369 RepID=UPI0019585E94|nr:YfhO family protein [Clostridium sardiniense]MBM7834694.1 putative membrane protein YfhO [Clostridium sardiniense]
MKNLYRIKKSPITIYTMIFIIIFSLYYIVFVQDGKTLIWSGDGINQHFSILYDFNEMIRNFIKDPSAGFPEWSWNIAYGSDVIGAYSYYVIGDLFSYLSLLFPLNKLELAYNLLIVLRLYCTGLAFIYYSKRMRFSNYGSILGSISYAFSGFILMSAIRHPYFINPLIILPIIFICIENILENKKKYLFSIIVAVSMISNFYFSYMIAIISIIYAFLRYIEIGKIRGVKFRKYFGSLFIYFSIGILISCIILLPTLYSIVTSSRISSDNSQGTILLYPIGYYINLLYSSISSGSYAFWTVLTLPILTFILLPVFIKMRKRYKTYFYMTIIFSIMILIPFFGSMMNGFSSISNRWTFVFTFLSSVIIAVGFDNLKEISKKGMLISIFILLSFVGLGVLNILFKKVSNNVFPSIFLGIITVIFIFYYMKALKNNISKSNRTTFIILLTLLSLNIVFNNYYRYSPSGNNYIKEFLSRDKAFSYYGDSFDGAENYIKEKDKTFYRIGKVDNISRDKTRNNSFVLNYNGIDSFLSINNGYLAEFSRSLNNRAFTPNSPIINFDNRPIVSNIMGVKYYVSRKDKDPRFDPSIKKIYDKGKFSIYEKEDVLPFGYVYSNILDKDVFEDLNGLEKEESLVNTASVDSKYLKSNIDDVATSNLESISFDTGNSTAKIIDKKIIITEPNQKVILNINPNETKAGNLFVNIKNLQYTKLPKGLKTQKEVDKFNNGNFNDKIKFIIKGFCEINKGDSFRINASYRNMNKNFNKPDMLDASGYFEMDDLIYNLVYYKDIKSGDSIVLTFNKAGEYSYESLDVINLPIEKYNNQFEKLRENDFKISSINDDKITGRINSAIDGVLTFQMPYSKGWKVKIDGEKVEAFPVNEAFLGVNLKSGSHYVELVYKTPFLRLGMIFSVIGIALLISIIIVKKKSSKKKVI